MTVRIYKSTDASAPVLTGQTGKLVDLLDAVLVNGYGALTAAGWTIAYTDTGKRVYTMAAGGTGFSLDVDDAGPGAGSFREARVRGVETPTGIGTGTNYFPTTGQTAVTNASLVIRKSATTDATARPWTIIADGHTFYLFVETGDLTTNFAVYPFMFGDFFTYSSSDTWNCMIIGRVKENIAYGGSAAYTSNGIWSNKGTNLAECFCALQNLPLTNAGEYLTDPMQGHFVARSYTGVGGSVPVGKHSDILAMGYPQGVGSYTPQMGYHGQGPTSNVGTNLWPGVFPYPNPLDSGLIIAPVFVHHNGFTRGYMKGFWNPIADRPLAHDDTYSGTGNLAGKSFLSQMIIGYLTHAGQTENQIIGVQCHVEYSDTWS